VARTVDPARHAARRLGIVDAALTCFARLGYDGATTAAICREAAIGSGTFFHYFPTKADVLLAILELGTAETREWFAAAAGRADARAVLADHIDRAVAEAVDPRIAGFVRAVSAVLGDPRIAAALAEDERVLRDGLLPWMARAQDAGQVRTDLLAERLTSWLMLLTDGFLGRIASEPAFTAAAEGDTLRDVAQRLLAP